MGHDVTRCDLLDSAPSIQSGFWGGNTFWPADLAESTPGIPKTLSRRGTWSGGGTRVPETSFGLSHLALGWTGAGAPGVRVRTRSGWGGWRTVHACHGGKDSPTGTGKWALVTTPGAIGYEVDSAGLAGLSATELNTVDGPVRARAAPAAGELRIGGRHAAVRYLSRAAWGADESLRFAADGTQTWPPEYCPVQTLTVHHTAGANNDPDPAATVRAIYYFDTITQGWGDLGYHLLIDEAGTVYEGRWSDTDPVPVFGPTSGADGRPRMADGAHVLSYNAGNVGVVLLGDFTSRLPTTAARASLTAVLAVLAGVERLDPLGTTDYVNPVNGLTKTVNTISGHRDWAATECPGNTFRPKLPGVRRNVAALLQFRR
jgi:hypothetical protein